METIGFRFSKALDEIYKDNSSKECAEEFHEHRQAIDRLKRADTLPAKMVSIARAKNISIDWLITGDGKMFNDVSVSQSGSRNIQTVGNNNSHIGNTNYNLNEIDQEIMSLLEYAPDGFKKKIIEKLTAYKKDTEDL